LQAGGHRFEPDKLHHWHTKPRKWFFFIPMFNQIQRNKSFYLKVLAIAVPFMLQQLITSSVNLLDNLMVGQLGDASIAGVAAANRFYFVAIFSLFGVNGAASIYMAQFFGAKRRAGVQQSFRFNLITGYLMVIPFIVIGSWHPEWIMRLFTQEADVVQQGALYLRMATLSYIPFAFSMVVSNAMRSLGETKLPLYISIVSVLSNAFLNYGLILGNFGFPALGVLGAAIATILSRTIEFIAYVIILKRRSFYFETRLVDIFKIPPKLLRVLIKKSIPLTLNEVLWSSGMAMLFAFYSTRGKEVMAGMSISGSVADLFFTLFGGMAVATTVIISQNLGANKLDEARDDAYRMIGFSMMLAALMGMTMFVSSFFVPNWYNVSAYSKEVATTLLRIMSLMFWIYMHNGQSFFILRAGGDIKSTMLMDSIFMWAVNLPVVAAFAYFSPYNVYVLYMAGQATDLIKLVLARSLIKREGWLQNLTEPASDGVELLEV
jgi:putative MATE family efflux protein